MSTRTIVITEAPRSQDRPVSLVMPDFASENIDQRLEEARNRELCSAFEAGMMIGSLIATLKLETLQLESENRRLEADITQLRVIHTAELNAAIDKREARRAQIAAKLELIVVKVDAFCKKWCQRGFSLIDAAQLRTLLGAVAKINYEHLRAYPKYSDVRNRATTPEVVMHTRDPFALSQTPPALLQSLQKRMEVYEALQAKTAPIRAANLGLIDTKDMMNAFHAHHLKTLRASEREARFESVLASIRSVYSQVKWEGRTISTGQCPKCWSRLIDNVDPDGVHYLHGLDCNPILEEQIKEIQRLLLDFISTLESRT